MSQLMATEWVLPATGDATFSLAAHHGRWLVVFFYPKDNTPGCTLEVQQFRDFYEEFQQCECDVVGLSRDSVRSHEGFKAKQVLPFELASDVDEVACAAFGVMKQKNMYGKQVRGIERSTFVFDQSGALLREWRGVKVEGHVEAVLNYVKGVSKNSSFPQRQESIPI